MSFYNTRLLRVEKEIKPHQSFEYNLRAIIDTQSLGMKMFTSFWLITMFDSQTYVYIIMYFTALMEPLLLVQTLMSLQSKSANDSTML